MKDNMKDKLILVIDDDDSIRKMIFRVLSCYGYSNVLQANNGQKGFQMVRKHNPDLVITDLTMPGMRGEEVIRWINKDHKPAHPQIKVIALSGDNQQIIGPVVKASGCDAFLPKPFHLSNFISTVEGLLA